jgi:hypothetical protein
MIQQIERDKKKVDVYLELVLVNSMIQTIWKTEPKLLVQWSRMYCE